MPILLKFKMLNPQNTRNYDAIQIMNPSILKIVLKLNQLIPQFHILLNSINRESLIIEWKLIIKARMLWKSYYILHTPPQLIWSKPIIFRGFLINSSFWMRFCAAKSNFVLKEIFTVKIHVYLIFRTIIRPPGLVKWPQVIHM